MARAAGNQTRAKICGRSKLSFSFVSYSNLFRLHQAINNRKSREKEKKEQSENMKLHFFG